MRRFNKKVALKKKKKVALQILLRTRHAPNIHKRLGNIQIFFFKSTILHSDYVEIAKVESDR